jgi:hypothetical protein
LWYQCGPPSQTGQRDPLLAVERAHPAAAYADFVTQGHMVPCDCEAVALH